MRKSNLLVYLKRFSKRDWREFGKFVRSPYFNQRQDLIHLLDYLANALSHSKPNDLHRKKVFAHVYPKESFDEKKLRHLASFLLKALKKYLAQSAFEEDAALGNHYLCKSLRKKGLEPFFEKEIKLARQQLEKRPLRDSKAYYEKYQLGLEKALYTMPKRRIGEMNFQAIADQLTISYISGILRLSCNMQSHQTMSGQGYDLKLLPDVLSLIESGNYENIPAVTLYYHCYNAIAKLSADDIEGSEYNFEQLKSQIRAHWRLFPPSEIRDIYLFSINYCIKRLNAGDRQFIREAFELFRSGLENETLLEEGILSAFSYKNITRLGMALNENVWVERFLEDYKTYLHPHERDNTWRYNLAFFYFQQKEYKRAMQLLLYVEFKDVLNNLDARRMLLKSYFELGEYNALDSLLDSFSRYIQRQKEIGYHRDNYLNLIRFVKKIIQTSSMDTQSTEALKAEIKATERLAERQWLLEKIN